MSRPALSRRERQIMDILFQCGRATAAQVRDALPDPPGYSAVRALLRILEEKGHVQHQAEDLRYVYMPVVERAEASRSAVRHLVDTFFNGSAGQAMAALLDESAAAMPPEELDRLARLIEKARQAGE